MQRICHAAHDARDWVRDWDLLREPQGTDIVIPRVTLQQHSEALTPEVCASKDVLARHQRVRHLGYVMVDGDRLDRDPGPWESRRAQVHREVQC